MCDQDHSEEDRKQYEALGLVTRKQFGKILGAGISMMLPQVANAADVTESDVNVKTPMVPRTPTSSTPRGYRSGSPDLA